MAEMSNRATLTTQMKPEPRHYLMFLPLYAVLAEVSIGVNAQATMAPGPARPAGEKPLLVYGTSIVHGSGASRAGMAYPAILGRRLNRATYNFGFSGNGIMQPEVVALLNELDPSMYVIDCMPNMHANQVTERLPALVHTFRGSHPDTPILVVEGVCLQSAIVRADVRERELGRNAAQRRVFDKLVAEGVTGLHYLPGSLVGEDGDGTADGTHPSDLGYCRIADALEPVLRKLL
jgi:hypothetical protein